MKRHGILFAIIALAASNFALAGGPPDMVMGAARFDSFDSKVEIMAKSDADGANATGRFRLRQANIDLDIEGEVTCLSVNGNWSAAAGTIVKSNEIGLLGLAFLQLTRDNGEGWDDSDQSQTAIFDFDPATCADFVGFDPDFAVDRGNYEVKDR